MTHDRHFVVALSGMDRDDALVRYAALVAWLGAGARQPDTDVVAAGRGLAVDPPARAGKDSVVLDAGRATKATTDGHAIVLTAPTGVRFIYPSEGTGSGAGRRLREAAAAEGADGVLIGPGSDRGLAERLIREAACSVWWVPDPPPQGIRRILVPVDFSLRAADSLRVATALARLSGAAECLALHVYFNDSPLADPRQDQSLRERLARDQARFLAGIDCLGVTVVPQLREGPNVARAVVRAAGEEQADLIVLASRGRTPAGALLQESVAEQALREARAPLLVIKHFGARLGVFRVMREQLLGRSNDLRFN